jgi:DNA-binding CsgD family transcriptional regulator/tetratricopeptide (TPR) repeat protein
MSTLPAPLRLAPSFPFVGRTHELRTLVALIPLRPGETRRVALVAGEAGSGKSRLIRELAQQAAGQGALVLYGGCDAVVRTPYRPFAEALDQLVRTLAPDELQGALGAAGGELRRLVPDLEHRIPGLPSPMAGDPDTERHRLHTAVGDVLSATSRERPVVLVIEDGHWADTPTLHLLRHLARTGADGRLLIVATFRDTEADVPAELADALADLRRADDVVRLRLGGLSVDEVGEFVRRAAGAHDDAPRALADAMTELTHGNAFLLCELWRTLMDTGAIAVEDGTVRLVRALDDLATPEGVREVVTQRVGRLGPATRDLLEVAAVAGPVFDLEVIQSATTRSADSLRSPIEEAAASGMLEDVPGRGLAYRFTHELVRRAIYDRLSGLRRAELHLRVAVALEAQPAARLRSEDLAHHYAAAIPLAPPQRAVHYHMLAAAAATASLAYDAAATHLQTAIDLGIDDERERAEAQLALGDAYYRGGASAASLEAFIATAAIARARDDGELLARAAIGFENACWRPALVDAGARELLEEAVAALPPDDSELRVRVAAGLARAYDFLGEADLSERTRGEAIAMARRLGDDQGLAIVFMRSYWSAVRSPMPGIVADLAEAARLATLVGDVELRAEAAEWRVAGLIGLGDMDAARRELARVRELAVQVRQPFMLHVAEHYRSAIALADGRLEEADEAAQVSQEWSRLLTGRDASGVYGIQMFNIRREQGRLAGLAPVMRVLAREGDGMWRPGYAALLADLGMHEEAREAVAAVRAEGLKPLRQLWVASIAYLADAATVLHDPALAAMLYPVLLPQAGANVMIGHGVAVLGSADRYLGMLAAVLGDREAADGHFAAALEHNRRMGARTWVAHTLAEHGLARGDVAMLDEAARMATHLGLRRVLGRIGTERAAAEPPDGLSPREVTILQLVSEGRSNRDIGKELVISEHTAANHVRSILRKTGCANRTEAAAYAHRRGLADPAPTR